MKSGRTKILLVCLVTFSLIVSMGLTGCQSGTGSASGNANLVYYSMWNSNEPQAKVLNQAIADFQKENKGVTISVNFVGRDISKTLPPALLAGTQVDIFDQDSSNVLTAFKGHCLDLTSYYNKTYPSTNGKAYKDTIVNSLYKLCLSYTNDGGIYEVPYQPYATVWLYNKDVFTKAGINAPPATWDDFVADCGKLQASGVTPFTSDDSYIDLMLGYHLARYIGAQGVANLVNDKSGASWNDAKVVQALTDLYSLAQAGYCDKGVATNKSPAGQVMLSQGKVAMYITGSWVPNEQRDIAPKDFNWGEFTYPTVANGDSSDNVAEAGVYGAQAFFINKDCKAADKAFDFLVYMTTGKYDQTLATDTIGAPMSPDTAWPAPIADVQKLFSSYTTCMPWAGGIEGNNTKTPIIDSNFTKLLAGQLDVQTFIKNVQNDIQ